MLSIRSKYRRRRCLDSSNIRVIFQIHIVFGRILRSKEDIKVEVLFKLRCRRLINIDAYQGNISDHRISDLVENWQMHSKGLEIW